MQRHSVLRRADRLAGGGARTAGEAQGQAYVKGEHSDPLMSKHALPEPQVPPIAAFMLRPLPTAAPLPFHQLITGPGIPPLKDQD